MAYNNVRIDKGDIMLFDTHSHINADAFNEDLEEVVNRALEEGVHYMMVIGFDKETNQRAIEIASKYANVYASVGFHPTIAHEIQEEDFVVLEEQLQSTYVVATGECGLDLHWHKDTLEDQIRVFKRQIDLSKKYGKPLVIHMRDVTEVMYETLKTYDALKGIMHSFPSSPEMAERFIKLGLHISLGGPVTFKNAKTPKEVAKSVPMDRLLIETDSPYLSPHPFRGKRNEPARVRLVAEEIANLRNLSYEEVASQTTRNALKLFGVEE
jgi:TatD DNase family protein